jgi:hypothetical protein
MATDHDRIVTVEHDFKDVASDVSDIKPRLRKVEDTILEWRTTVTIAKAILGAVSISIVLQLAIAFHII